ncbi:hypothetical protein, partial [Campylobacter molothri]|uniref:hypothetical protein n=1 Tax=Campylobacter molothri TaxID=1032242 RepID=UPI00301CE170|nr:hypothetical protein [Campylobacter sp. RM10542]
GVEVVWFDHYFYIEDNSINCHTIIELFNLRKSVTLNSFQIVYLLNKVKYNMFHFAWSGLIDFTFLLSNNIMFLNNIIWEDHLFGIKLLINANLFYIFNIKQYYYRIRSNSICYSNELYPHISYLSIFFDNKIYARKYYERYSWVVISKHIIKNIENLKKEKLKKIMKKAFFEYYINRSQQFLFCTKDPLQCHNDILIRVDDNILLFKDANKNTLYNFIIELYGKMHDIILLHEQDVQNKQEQIERLHQDMQSIKNVLDQTKYLLSFQYKYGTAKLRIKSQLPYILGKIMISSSKSKFGILLMPIYIVSAIFLYHKKKVIYQNKYSKLTSFLPPLESYPDYIEALKEKECFTYKLGEALIRANKNWYKGGYIKFWFEVKKLKKEKYK